MPPTRPDPDALDQTRFASTVSGVAQPLSPPPTDAPLAAPDPDIAGRSLRLRVARPHRRRAVLLVAVDVVRDAVVDRHVIHLRDRQLHADATSCPRLIVMRDAAVVRHDEPVAVRRIDPDVVVIAARRPASPGRSIIVVAAVERLREVRREEVRLVRRCPARRPCGCSTRVRPASCRSLLIELPRRRPRRRSGRAAPCRSARPARGTPSPVSISA